jgi:hypothetical protein
MGIKVFIPVSDELIFDRPELISAPLRPYTENLACYHWLDVRISPADDSEVSGAMSKRNPVSKRKAPHYARDYPHTVAA